MTKEPFDLPGKQRAMRGSRLEETEAIQLSQPQEPQEIDFSAGAVPIQSGRLPVRIGSLKEQPATEKQAMEGVEIDVSQLEPRIGYPGKRASSGGPISDPEGE